MELRSYTAMDLFGWLTQKETLLLLDVRNDEEFGRFKVEGPYPFEMVNVPYMEFIEHEEESVAQVPKGKPVRIVCAKEGSAKYLYALGHQSLGESAGADLHRSGKRLRTPSVPAAGKGLLQLWTRCRKRDDGF